MRVLVTGGTGFVGRHLVRRLMKGDHKVYSLSRRLPLHPEPGVHYLRGDLVDIDPTIFPSEIDVLVHQAALIDDPFKTNPPLTSLASVNIVGTLSMLDIASRLGVQRFVYGSTGGVVGSPSPDQEVEDPKTVRPTDYYGLTKYLAEHAVFGFAWPFEVTSLRYFAPYAADGSNPLIIHLIDSIQSGAEITVGRDDGPSLQPVHISDTVELTVRAIEMDNPPKTVDIAGPTLVTVAEIAELLGGALGKAALIRRTGSETRSRIADTEYLAETLGPPLVTPAQGIEMEWGHGRRSDRP